MRIAITALAALGALSIAACSKPAEKAADAQADAVEANANAAADQMNAQADAMKANADAAAAIFLRLVLQSRAFGWRCFVALLLVVDLHDVTVGVTEAVGPAAAEIAVSPANPKAGLCESGGAAQIGRAHV